MISCGAAWTTRMRPRWFVRVVALCVGIANLVGLAEGLVLGLPLAASAGALRDD